jgi:hypothetical protein
MFEGPKIEWMAQLRRREIAQEVFGLSTMKRGLTCSLSEKTAHLDLNIRLVLQPRVSLSIWLGRGAS